MSLPIILRILKGDQLIAIKQSMENQIVVGRGSGALVDLDDESISPIHAVIDRRDAGYYISDLGSRSGTKKNGQAILDAHLDSGDIIEIGAFTIEFYLGIPKPKAPPAAKPASVVIPAAPVQANADKLETIGAVKVQVAQDSPATEPVAVPVPLQKTTPAADLTPDIRKVVPEAMTAKVSTIEASEVAPAQPETAPPTKTEGQGDPSLDTGVSLHAVDSQIQEPPQPVERRKREAVTQIHESPSPAHHRGRWARTFAPGNLIGDMRGHVKPSKGTVVEILVVWNHRVLNTYHFTERGTVSAGIDKESQVLIPVLTGNQKRIPIVVIDTQIVVLVPSEVFLTLIRKQEAVAHDALVREGRLLTQGAFRQVRLEQGEMGVLDFGYGMEVYIRYVPEAPKPALGPLLDLTPSELMGLILAAVVAGVLSLLILLQVPPALEEDKDKEEENQRKAVFVYNRVEKPPTPPPPPAPTPPPPPEPTPVPTPVKVVKVEVTDKKPTTKQTKTPNRVVKKDGPSEGRMGAVRANPNAKPRTGVSAAKSGGSVKIGTTAGANAKSEKVDINNAGLLGAFGNKGIRDRLDQTYSGSGTALGLADQATGTSGQTSDRAGDDIGSALKETSSGRGKNTIGVGGVKTVGRGGGNTGYGVGGLGNREKVSVLPGGDEEDFTGTIDREAVRRVVRQHINELRACYERGLNLDESLGGKVVLEWEFGQRGRVLKVRVVSSSLSNRSVESCLMKRLQSWTFPEPPPNQIAVVKYPFVFNSK